MKRDWSPPPARRLRRLQQDNAALAAVGADADNRARSRWSARKLFHRLTQDSRSRRAKRVTQRNAAAVRIHSFSREGAEVHCDACFLTQELRAFECLDVG